MNDSISKYFQTFDSWNEASHQRAKNGQFGKGGGSTKGIAQKKRETYSGAARMNSEGNAEVAIPSGKVESFKRALAEHGAGERVTASNSSHAENSHVEINLNGMSAKEKSMAMEVINEVSKSLRK
jgi:hypothetical protein